VSRVLVTGAASGLGLALVRRFAGRGDDVLATDVADAPTLPDTVRFQRLDVRSDEDWEVLFAPDEKEFSFAKAKCSISEAEPITFAEARNPPTFHWLFAAYAAPGIALALGIAACIYGLLRAIGWVIGGFAA